MCKLGLDNMTEIIITIYEYFSNFIICKITCKMIKVKLQFYCYVLLLQDYYLDFTKCRCEHIQYLSSLFISRATAMQKTFRQQASRFQLLLTISFLGKVTNMADYIRCNVSCVMAVLQRLLNLILRPPVFRATRK